MNNQRIIKFRSWSKKNGWKFFTMEENTRVMSALDCFRNGPLQQYTGLKDKNGKEIYEDDVIRLSNPEFTQTIHVDSTQSFFFSYRWYVDNKKNLELEVIGNIYENPELLTNDKHKE